jgi:GNAT superfamily N-acetyltransferase
MKFIVEKISFEDTEIIWSTKLWANRESPIRPMSSMIYKKGYDLNIYKKYKPTFFGIKNCRGSLVGVNSGHRTSDEEYRSRGLWIDSDYRNLRLSRHLFESLEIQAKEEKCKYIWSIPRKESLYAYIQFGFLQSSDFFDEGVEFGPNCYVIKEVQ